MTDKPAKPVIPDPAANVKPLPTDGDWDRDEGADWRHEPRPVHDESPLESFGKSIGAVVTGSGDDVPGKPATDDPAKPRKP